MGWPCQSEAGSACAGARAERGERCLLDRAVGLGWVLGFGGKGKKGWAELGWAAWVGFAGI